MNANPRNQLRASLLALLLANALCVGWGVRAHAQPVSPIDVLATMRPHAAATHAWEPAENATHYNVHAERLGEGSEWEAWRKALKRIGPRVSREYLMDGVFRLIVCARQHRVGMPDAQECGESSLPFSFRIASESPPEAQWKRCDSNRMQITSLAGGQLVAVCQ